jgi:transposase-like protein
VLDMLRDATAVGNVDVPRDGVRVLAEAILEAEISELHQRSQGRARTDRRLTNRNGYREWRWDTRVGTVRLSISKVRDGPYFPNRASVIRLVGMILAEQDNKWQDGRALLPAQDDGGDRYRHRPRGGEPGAPHGDLNEQARGGRHAPPRART